MPTNPQLKLIHVAARAVGLNDAQYRTLLKNAAGVESSKSLSHEAFEDVMAVLEDLGFGAKDGVAAVYWRNKVRDRGGQGGNARMVHKIRELSEGSRYAVDALAFRFSGGRTDRVEELLPREAWQLIEMLKAAEKRENTPGRHEGAPDGPGKEPPQGRGRGHEARTLFG